MRKIKSIIAFLVFFVMCFSVGCAPKQHADMQNIKDASQTQNSANNIIADDQAILSAKLDSYGTVYDGKRAQTYGSDTPLHNAESGISNAPIAGNGSIGVTMGGSAVGQSMNIGMNDFWDGKYSSGLAEGEGILPLTVGSVGYDVLDSTSTAKADRDLAPMAESATVSSQRSGDFSPWAAVGGDYVSVAYWGFGWWSSGGSNHWLKLEFSEPITFQRFVIWNASTARNGTDVNHTTGVSGWNTDTYRIETSATGAEGSWTQVYRETGNKQPICDRDLPTPTTAKFVRLFIEDPGTDNIARINKFSLYANPQNDPNLMPKLVNGAGSAIAMSTASFSGDANSAGTDAYGTVMGRVHNLAGWGQRGYGWMFGNATGQHITYTLNAPTSFKSYQLFNGSASAAASYNSRDFLGWELQVSSSETGEDFTTAHEVLPSTDTSIAGGQPSVSSFDLAQEATNVKRIRLKCAKTASGSGLLAQLKIFAGTLSESGIQTQNSAVFHQDIRRGRVGADCSYNGKQYSADTALGQNGKNYIVTKFENKSNAPMDFRYYTFAHRYRLPAYTQNAGVSADGKTIYSTRTTQVKNTLAWVASATIAATIEGGTWTNANGDSSGTAYGDFTVPASGTAYIITCVDGRQYNASNVPAGYTLTQTASNIRANNTPTQALAIADSQAGVGSKIMEDSDAFWFDFWGKSFVDVGDIAVEKYYYNALYIAGSATREDNVPASLFGPFTTSDTMAWGGAYTTDYNMYGTYMALAGSNRADLLKPLARNALESWGGTALGGGMGKEYGKQLNSLNHLGPFKDKDNNWLFKNGVDGILSAVVSGPHGYAVNQAGFFYVMFTSAYAAIPVMSYYDMTQGQGEIAPGVTLDTQMEYDYLKDLMLLWEQVLYYEDGQYKVKNDGAWEFEQVGGAVDPNGHITSNAFTIASLHNFSRRLVKDASKLGITVEDEPRLAKWQDIDANLEPFPTTNAVGRDGVTRFVYSDTKESADENSVTYSTNRNPNVVVAQCFPLGDLGLYSSNEEKQIMRNTLATLQAWDNMNAMPTIFSVASRVGYTHKTATNDVWFDRADNLLDEMSKVVSWGMAQNNICNLYDPLELIDTCGGAQGLNDMLVQKDKGIITLFPAFPSGKDARFANLQLSGGYLVSATYTAQTQTMSGIKIESKFGGDIALALPSGVNWKIVDSDGNTVTTKKVTVASLLGINDHTDVLALSFNTLPTKTYFVTAL